MRRPEHPDDGELLMALDRELANHRQTAVDAHVLQCEGCQSRLWEIRSTLAEARLLDQSELDPSEMDAQVASPPHARVHLEHALRKAADEWNSSWLVRLHDAVTASPVLGLVAVTISLALLIAWLPQSHSARLDKEEDRPSLPISAFTPGAVSGLTAKELCAGARPARLVTLEAKERVLRDYGMEHVSPHAYELDALVTPELGGTTEPENLWPQRYESPIWNARVKDELERLLPTLVCSNRIELAQAQRDMAADWVAAYKRYFRTDTPLQAHVGPPLRGDDEDLEFAAVRHGVGRLGASLRGARIPAPPDASQRALLVASAAARRDDRKH